jgi:hypothetical protein
MALIELTKVVADDPAVIRRWGAEPLPLTDRLRAVITSKFPALPESARAALLLAAVADDPDLGVAARQGGGPDAEILAPAEELGLITVDRAGLQFAHPVVRSAVYHSAPAIRSEVTRPIPERPGYAQNVGSSSRKAVRAEIQRTIHRDGGRYHGHL